MAPVSEVLILFLSSVLGKSRCQLLAGRGVNLVGRSAAHHDSIPIHIVPL